jgi:hypothetical protein
MIMNKLDTYLCLMKRIACQIYPNNKIDLPKIVRHTLTVVEHYLPVDKHCFDNL